MINRATDGLPDRWQAAQTSQQGDRKEREASPMRWAAWALWCRRGALRATIRVTGAGWCVADCYWIVHGAHRQDGGTSGAPGAAADVDVDVEVDVGGLLPAAATTLGLGWAPTGWMPAF